MKTIHLLLFWALLLLHSFAGAAHSSRFENLTKTPKIKGVLTPYCQKDSDGEERWYLGTRMLKEATCQGREAVCSWVGTRHEGWYVYPTEFSKHSTLIKKGRCSLENMRRPVCLWWFTQSEGWYWRFNQEDPLVRTECSRQRLACGKINTPEEGLYGQYDLRELLLRKMKCSVTSKH
jgi:hypothetical protein